MRIFNVSGPRTVKKPKVIPERRPRKRKPTKAETGEMGIAARDPEIRVSLFICLLTLIRRILHSSMLE